MMMPGTEHDVDDLVWHGRALCRALHRAWEAEAEAAELRASLDHCLTMGAKSHEQIVELCRLLDEARADLREFGVVPQVTPLEAGARDAAVLAAYAATRKPAP